MLRAVPAGRSVALGLVGTGPTSRLPSYNQLMRYIEAVTSVVRGRLAIATTSAAACEGGRLLPGWPNNEPCGWSAASPERSGRHHGRYNSGMTGATAARKVLDVLGAFQPDARRLALSEISRRAGLALSTAHRVVAELESWGALERGDDGCYSIGLRLYEVGVLAPRGTALRDAAMPFMEDLYELTHEVVQLAVREGPELVFTERLAGRTSVGVHTQVGLRFPLPPSGAGLVLLAFAPPEIQEAVLAGQLQRFTPKTLVDPAELRTVLAEVRRTGIAFSDRQVTMDSFSVGAPVRDASGAVVAAVSLVVHAGSSDAAMLAALLGAAARGISRSLAGTSALQPATEPLPPLRTSGQR